MSDAPKVVRLWRCVFTTIYFVVALPLLLVGSPVYDMDWHAGNGPAWWKWIRMEGRWP